MIRPRFCSGMAAWLALVALASPVLAEYEGQEDLDRATALQIQAQTLADLEQVARLCEQALEKGLDEGNRQFAKQLLSSTLYQHAHRLTQPIFEQMPPDRRWPLLRQFALRDLERVIEVDPAMGEAHLLIARLHALPGGERSRAQEAAEAAVAALENEPRQQAAALVVRAELRDEVEQRLEDFDLALQRDPGNADAWQGRALTYMEQGEMDKAIEDLHQLLEKNKDNVNARLALAETLAELDKLDEAREQVEEAIRLNPDLSLAYTLRARLHLIEEDAESALADLDHALRLNPQDLRALMIRASVRLTIGDLDDAKRDVEQALLLSPGLIQAIVIRSRIAAEEGRMSDAVADMQLLLQEEPENTGWQLQLGYYYIQDRRPSKAIEVFSRVLADDPGNTLVRQIRADQLLTIGKHEEAIADYEILVKEDPENDSILNNFAWVLATSPDDHLRDAPRALELALKAGEISEYNKAHVLSTMAAAYAESGDFENAVRWAEKALEVGTEDEEVEEQLRQELESFQQEKPWRERQTVEEKEEPIQPRRRPLDA